MEAYWQFIEDQYPRVSNLTSYNNTMVLWIKIPEIVWASTLWEYKLMPLQA